MPVRPRLIITAGVPGSGKSTFALRMIERWGAVSFASESFADQLGPASRTASGDLSKEAILHAYRAMGDAVAHALAEMQLVVAVGSFRSQEQRRRFREIAKSSGASVTTLRVVCPVETAARRIRARMAHGERGPDEKAIRQIEDGLNRAEDIDLVLTNDSSMQDFHRRIDAVLEPLLAAAGAEASDRKGRIAV